MKNQTLIVRGLFLLYSFFLIGCDSIKSDWEKTERSNTVESYQEFLSRHPKSEFAEYARKRIGEIISEESFHKGLQYAAKGNFGEAKEAFEKAANYDHPVSMCLIGILYNLGWGVDRGVDRDAATNWYKKAAQHGIKECSFEFAQIQISGWNIEKGLVSKDADGNLSIAVQKGNTVGMLQNIVVDLPEGYVRILVLK